MSTPFGEEIYHNDRRFAELTLNGRSLTGLEFNDCHFEHCSFSEATLERCRFVDCTFQQCDFSLAQLPDTVFAGSHFEDCRLLGLNWTAAGWPKAGLGRPLHFTRCILNHSTFIGLDLARLVLVDCTAVDVDFREANLTKADFSGADLDQSLFLHTNLAGADFSRARNYRIDPTQNTLTRAYFTLPEAMSLLYSLDIVLEEGS